MGPEFQVNSYTTSYQTAPQVAADPDGNFVVVWNGRGPNLGGYGVFARLFDNTATPLADEFVVNGFTAAQAASVARNTGSFVVVWQSGQDNSGDGVYAEKYDGSGSAVTGLLPVNTYTTGDQGHARVAMDSAGNFVVVWDSYGGQDGDGLGVFGQRFDSSGNKLGSEFLVNTETAGHQDLPDVAMTSGGAYVVVWMTEPPVFGDPGKISGQRYDSDGSPQGPEFQVNELTTGVQQGPRVAIDPSGNFVVAWSTIPPLGDEHEVFARRFDSFGTPLGNEFLVGGAFSTDQIASDVAVDETGKFTIVWDFRSPATLGQYQLKARRYDSAGRPMGNEYFLSTATGGLFTGGAIALDSREGFVAVWGCTAGDCPSDDSVSGIAGRRGGFPSAGELSVDARPSGGTSNVNGVLEAGERVAVDPEWINGSTTSLPLTGSASNLAGPAGPTYSLDDATADYASIAAGAGGDCYDATTDCFELSVSGARPAAHWDVTFDEALSSGVTKTWTLHVGESFPDVPPTHSFYGFIENIFHNGITGGCGGGGYCPGNAVTRAQMAVFLLKAEHGSTYAPPACAGVFGDVACPSLFADWIERLADEEITGGCGGGNYCPTNPNTRGQMAVFLVKTFELELYGP